VLDPAVRIDTDRVASALQRPVRDEREAPVDRLAVHLDRNALWQQLAADGVSDRDDPARVARCAAADEDDRERRTGARDSQDKSFSHSPLLVSSEYPSAGRADCWADRRLGAPIILTLHAHTHFARVLPRGKRCLARTCHTSTVRFVGVPVAGLIAL